jgi:hypothetical protein
MWPTESLLHEDIMKPVTLLLCLLYTVLLAACGVRADRFPGAVVPSPIDLVGQWQMTLGGQVSVFSLEPATANHYKVTSGAGGPAETMDASIQQYGGAHYLVVTDTTLTQGVSVFRVVDAAPATLRIAALDPAKTEAFLKARGLPVARKKMWLYEEIELTGPSLQAVLDLPAADIFALDQAMTLTRQ